MPPAVVALVSVVTTVASTAVDVGMSVAASEKAKDQARESEALAGKQGRLELEKQRTDFWVRYIGKRFI